MKAEDKMYDELRRIKGNCESEVSWKEKLLAKEICFLKLEMNVRKANKKMEKALQTLVEIDQGNIALLKIRKGKLL